MTFFTAGYTQMHPFLYNTEQEKLVLQQHESAIWRNTIEPEKPLMNYMSIYSQK
jgi:hypothetical protein